MPEFARRRVGVVGLGRMGELMAARLLQAGYMVSGFDVNQGALDRFCALGGKAAATPFLAALGAEVLLVMVHDATQVESVLFGTDGASGALAPGCVLWLGSTVPPVYAERLDVILTESNVMLIDGPVSGGTIGAEEGSLVAICGATTIALETGAFVLKACTKSVHHVGKPGKGSTIKLINQLLFAAHSALTCEAMALADRAGVDPIELISVIETCSGSSRIFEKRAPKISIGDHAAHVTINTLKKDLNIVIESARLLGIEPTIALSVQSILIKAIDAGYGDTSDTTLVKDYLGTRERGP